MVACLEYERRLQAQIRLYAYRAANGDKRNRSSLIPAPVRRFYGQAAIVPRRLHLKRETTPAWLDNVRGRERWPSRDQHCSLERRLASESNSWTSFSSAVLDETPHQIMQGSLWPYVQAARVFICPSDHSLTRTRKPRVRSYSLNGNLAGRTNEVQTVALRMDQIPEPARLLSFICEHEDSIDDGHFLVWPYPDDRWVNMPSGRHANAGVLSFCDGHVETWTWRAPKRFKPRTTYWKAAETAEDRADLIRLQNVVFLAEKYRRQP